MDRGPGRRTFEAEDTWFLDECWFRLGAGGEAMSGCVLPRLTGSTLESLRLPRPGDLVWQGIPFAAAQVAGRPPRTLPAPLSGTVIEINTALSECPSAVFDDPCGEGWIARIRPNDLAGELPLCIRRQVILVTAGFQDGLRQADLLHSLGCHTAIVTTRNRLTELLTGPTNPAAARRDGTDTVFVIDAEGFGVAGPALVGDINARTPGSRVIVAAGEDSRWEAAYRTYRVFYYAIRPFADLEIVDILDAAFRRPWSAPECCREQSLQPRRPCLLRVTTADSLAASILVALENPDIAPRLLGTVHALLSQRGIRSEWAEAASGDWAAVSKTETACGRRVIMLQAEEKGRLPGTLTCLPSTAGPSQDSASPTVFRLQPWNSGEGPIFEERTLRAIARHIVRAAVDHSKENLSGDSPQQPAATSAAAHAQP